MWILIVIGVIILLLAGLFLLCTECNKGAAFIFGAVFGAYIISGAILMLRDPKPTAMDVYQGKTTLEIHYKNGVPIDSVVVFKDKKNNYGNRNIRSASKKSINSI